SYIMDYYIKQRNVVLYNTYVNYQTKNWGFKAGNINENLDYPINGRGIAAKTIWDHNKTLNLYAVENQYMLLNTFTNGIPGIKTVAADYYDQHSAFENWRATYIRNTYSLNGLVQNQISGKYNKLLGRGSTLGFEAGLSTEAYKANGQVRGAFALGANYSGDIDRYKFTSNNYYSSPYYTGLRRGLLQSQTQMVRRIDDNNSLSAYISILSSNPKDLYRDTVSLFNNFRKNAISIFELGYNRQFGRYGLNLRPYLLVQKLNGESYITGEATSGTWSSGSARMAAALSYNSKGQSFFIQTDYGYNYHNYVGAVTGARHSLRINGSFTSAFMGVSTLIQINPYYLSDILSFGNGTKYRIYSFGPIAHITPVNKQLDIQASVMYNHYSFNRTDNYSANGNIRWLQRNNWTLTGTLFYNMLDQRSANYQKDYYGPVQSQRYNNFQLSIGIEKQFGTLFNKKRKKLELSYYEDTNGNGKKDDDESLAKGVVVALNGQAAITSNEGKVKYTNLKEGDYEMALKSSNGWSLQNPVYVSMHKNMKLEIPLIKTKVLKGAVVVVKDRFIKENVVLSGIVIEAIGVTGKAVETLTNENGEFYFYLPPGKYTVFVKSKSPSFLILNKTEEVNLTAGDAQPVIFRYKNQSRKVDVKQF
ncbi:MAG TPA: SdrD B-like domain-containing protein, partial [Mucilaginibacter sp.]